MKILILGSSGLLGGQIFEHLNSYKKLKILHNGLKFRKYNLTYKYQLEELLIKSNADLIINCSGITNIDYCEKDKKNSYRINVSTVKNIFNYKLKVAIKKTVQPIDRADSVEKA